MAGTRSLRKREDFDRTLQRGRRSGVPGLSVIAAVREDDGELRLGVAVRARGAVVRNRIKRRIRAAAGAAGVRGVDLVVRADGSVAGKDFQEMVAVIKEAARRAEG